MQYTLGARQKKKNCNSKSKEIEELYKHLINFNDNDKKKSLLQSFVSKYMSICTYI
jgi:hypothetical protein